MNIYKTTLCGSRAAPSLKAILATNKILTCALAVITAGGLVCVGMSLCSYIPPWAGVLGGASTALATICLFSPQTPRPKTTSTRVKSAPSSSASDTASIPFSPYTGTPIHQYSCFPKDLMKKVFSYLPLRDLCNADQVCQPWHSIITEVWRTRCPRYQVLTSDEQTTNWRDLYRRELSYLHFVKYGNLSSVIQFNCASRGYHQYQFSEGILFFARSDAFNVNRKPKTEFWDFLQDPPKLLGSPQHELALKFDPSYCDMIALSGKRVAILDFETSRRIIYSYHPESDQLEELLTVDEDIRSIRKIENYLLVSTKDRCYIYSIDSFRSPQICIPDKEIVEIHDDVLIQQNENSIVIHDLHRNTKSSFPLPASNVQKHVSAARVNGSELIYVLVDKGEKLFQYDGQFSIPTGFSWIRKPTLHIVLQDLFTGRCEMIDLSQLSGNAINWASGNRLVWKDQNIYLFDPNGKREVEELNSPDSLTDALQNKVPFKILSVEENLILMQAVDELGTVNSLVVYDLDTRSCTTKNLPSTADIMMNTGFSRHITFWKGMFTYFHTGGELRVLQFIS